MIPDTLQSSCSVFFALLQLLRLAKIVDANEHWKSHGNWECEPSGTSCRSLKEKSGPIRGSSSISIFTSCEMKRRAGF
jgi:hypothetical protein